MDMKRLVTAAILALAASWSSAALAQVYGGEDDPYQQNPFASNIYVPPTPDAATTATPAPTPPSLPPQDAGKTQQQTAASTGDQAAKKQTQP
jgi:hypothetical protein